MCSTVEPFRSQCLINAHPIKFTVLIFLTLLLIEYTPSKIELIKTYSSVNFLRGGLHIRTVIITLNEYRRPQKNYL